MSSGQLLIPIEYLGVPLPAACFLVRHPFETNQLLCLKYKLNYISSLTIAIIDISVTITIGLIVYAESTLFMSTFLILPVS